MSFSSDLYTMAKEILAREGQTVTVSFQDMDAGDYDFNTGVNTPASPVNVGAKAIFLDFALLTNGTVTRGGAPIEASDRQVYLSATPITGSYPRKPSTAGDYITDAAGNKWRIFLIKEYNPSGSLPIMYDLLVRK